jgi:micrococcal nuclease
VNRKWEILFFLSFLIFLTVSLSAQAEEGVVTAVYDGDTIKVRFDKGNIEVVRLIGINSPELTDSREKVRFMALMAKRFSYYILYDSPIIYCMDKK